MPYTRPAIVSGVTKLHKAFFENLFDGVDEKLSAADANATYATRYVTAATAGNLATLVRKLDRGVTSAGVLIISDSTGNATDEWAYITAQFIAEKYPAYTVTVRFWDEVGETDYSAPVTVQTGSGTQTLTVWIAAKAGGIPGYFLGSRFNNAIRATSPDVVIINHGHNMGDPTSSESAYFGIRNAYLACTESIARIHPFAGFVMLSQNPTSLSGRETWQASKANIVDEIAGIRGYGFIDVHQAFIDYGNWSDLTNVDGIHPNPTGSALWSSLIEAGLTEARGAVPTKVSASPLLLTAKNYLTNFDFSDWSGTDPASWTPNAGATTSKDTTNFESGTQACKVTGTATTGLAQIEGAITGGAARELRGEWVTVAVRVRKPTSNTATVRVQVVDSTGTGNQRVVDVPSTALDGYIWVFVNKRIDLASTGVYVRLISRTSGTATVEASFDRAYLVKGLLPFAG